MGEDSVGSRNRETGLAQGCLDRSGLKRWVVVTL